MNNNTLDGVKMLHHDEMRNYDRIQGKIISVIMNHGCKIIETPSFEDYDVYQHFFPQLRQQMVKTIDTDGRVLVLRPDVTLPLVETAAREFPRSNQLLKFGYVSTVFREYYGRSTYGKDFLQGGIEILGDSSPECDGEVIVTAAEILKAVGVENIRIDIGTAAYTQALFDGLPISEEEKETLKGYMADRNLVACKSYIAALPVSADAQVHDFVDVGARRFFDEDVLADDTDVSGAAFDVDSDVRRLDQGHFELALGVFKDELAALFGIRREIIAAFG